MYRYEDIRNFYFENEIGERINCQKIDGGLFLYNVAGLGYEENIEYAQIGNTFIQKDKKMVQNQITGDLEFYNMTYDEYCNFIDFILMSTSLRLIYVPKKTKRVEYYRDIDVCKIDKAEEDEFNVLTCPIVINCKSLWYEENTVVYSMKGSGDEIKWDFKWDSKFADYSTRKLTFINKGHVPAPILVEIEGPVQNPRLELYIEGELYQTVTINIELDEYEKLLYGTKEGDFYINKQNTDGTLESLFSLDYIDFNSDSVIEIPQNYSCELRIKAENDIRDAKVTILVFYKAV